jgi:hypothetical protein
MDVLPIRRSPMLSAGFCQAQIPDLRHQPEPAPDLAALDGAKRSELEIETP